MLVLSRKIGEVLCLGDDITITIVDIRPNSGSVRIGIDAPEEVAVWRQEIKELRDADQSRKQKRESKDAD